MKDFVERKAYAKINLGLDVIRRREDGYHEVKMIMQTVDIWDRLTFTAGREPGIELLVGDEAVPAGKENLIYRAAELILKEKKIDKGIKITLEKNIPIAAGMAGGSTDAAAVFHGLNELFGLCMDLEEMKRLGVRIGADVPYCIMGGTALSEGIGELLTPLPAPPECVLVAAKPEISVSTKFVYENLHVDRLKRHPDIDGMIGAIKSGSLSGITERMENVLETVTIREYPVIERIKEQMKADGAVNALMSGSGPTVFGVFTEKEAARQAADRIREQGLAGQVFVTRFYHGDCG
ncbi:MAG: 4-(cytidine 5'-diphospho)-2-C-methyl-D-erythritol kinase [Lachnospiraceae bacterium]|nr:4-(cytidine 5'-diphospho)-2-C-methyl-D-erythritol kinase [Lachnospiraceae bacterium]